MVSPYMTYIPMPSMSCGEGSKTDASKDQVNKRKRTESGKENLSRPLSPHGFSVDRTGKVTSLPFAHPVFPTPVPVQEEPCDLSMPKRRRSPEDPMGFRIEAGPHASTDPPRGDTVNPAKKELESMRSQAPNTTC